MSNVQLRNQTLARHATGKKLGELSEEHKSTLHNIDKRQVNVKAAEGTGDIGGVSTPTSDQLSAINEFTRTPKSADELAVFDTWSCNDMYDRDDERFTPDTIDAFAALPQPFSFTGKSFMADHDYKMEKVRGRIFDTGTDTQGDTNFVTNSIYVPRTPQHEAYLENVDFGLAWAVSVGVVIDKATCSISTCGAPVYQSRFFGAWCSHWHDKGYFYDPNDDTKNDWGEFIPVEPDTPGAEKAKVDLSDPIDAYELSQVFLGAQYFAELAKRPDFQGVIKAASKRALPIVGLSREEARTLGEPDVPEQVAQARRRGIISTSSAGTVTWTDGDSGLAYSYAPGEEILCLGVAKSDTGNESDNQEGDNDGEAQQELERDGVEDPVGEPEPDPEAGSGDGPEGVGDEGVGDAGGEPGQAPEQLSDPAPDNDNEEEEDMSKEAVVNAARAAGVAPALIERATAASGNGLPELLGGMVMASAGLVARAALGDEYVKVLKDEAIRYYTLSHQDPKSPEAGVPIERFQTVLDACGDNVVALKSLRDDQEALAQAKFPSVVRRSVAPSDPHPGADHDGPQGEAAQDKTRQVSRLHG